MRYPLANFLLKTSTNKRVNMLPNCAQGATQLSFGTVRYTKVREIVRDRNHYFMGLQRVDQMQVGDLALIVWDYQADAQTNSGHTGVIV
ncbi:MAG TPA: hypothetical protein ENI73_05600, partial [Spirochaetes bacterium]|nr:hypothetical protein [Spirochaetota bacterium]